MPSNELVNERISIKKALAKGLVTFGLLGYLISRVEFGQLLPRMAGVSVEAILTASLLIFLTSVPITLRWKLVLAHLGHNLWNVKLWKLVIVGMFFNQFLPTGVGGDVTRIWYLHRDGVPLGSSITSILMDRVLGIVGLAAAVVLGIPILLKTGVSESMNSLLVIGTCFALGLSATIFADILLSPMINCRAVQRALRKIPHGERLVRAALNVATRTRQLILSWPGGPSALALSAASFLMASTAAYTLARALDSNVNLSVLIFLFPAVLLFSMLPVSLGGWGVREGAMVLLFGLVGTSHEDALAISILFGVCLVCSGIPGAAAWVLFTHRRVNATPELNQENTPHDHEN